MFNKVVSIGDMQKIYYYDIASRHLPHARTEIYRLEHFQHTAPIRGCLVVLVLVVGPQTAPYTEGLTQSDQVEILSQKQKKTLRKIDENASKADQDRMAQGQGHEIDAKDIAGGR
jgi:hypothetical protein